MASAKSVFEKSTAADTSPPSNRKSGSVSKWDRPKATPPPPVNRDGEEPTAEADPELPPPSYTKNLRAKFESLQQSSNEDRSGQYRSAGTEDVNAKQNNVWPCCFYCIFCSINCTTKCN